MYIQLIGAEINMRMPKIKTKEMLNAGKRTEDFQRLRLNSVSMKNASSFDITTKQKEGYIRRHVLFKIHIISNKRQVLHNGVWMILSFETTNIMKQCTYLHNYKHFPV